MSWSSEDLTRLKELTRDHTVKQICEELGKTDNEVRHKIRTLRLKTRSPHERSLREAQEIYDFSEAHGCKAAGEKFKMSEASVKALRSRHASRMEKRNEDLSGDNLHDLWKKALKYALFHDMESLSQDFASFAVMQRIQNPLKAIYFKTLMIDFKRIEFGNQNTEVGNARALAMHTMTSLHQDSDEDEPTIDPVDERSADKLMKWIDSIESAGLNERERIVTVLVVWAGFMLKEVGFMLGVSEGRVSQIFKVACDKINQNERKPE